MITINTDIIKNIGNTPLIRLNGLIENINYEGNIYAKLEYYNPFGSIKDRVALMIIQEAERLDLLSNNKTIIEATSGNMGIGLAAISQIKGYKCKIIMPKNMSNKRKALIKSYGADLILTKENDGMQGSISKAHEILSKNKFKYYFTDQFNNYASINAHYLHTAPEIFNQLKSNIDVIICGIGTGATIMGIGNYFKCHKPSVEIIGILPIQNPHHIQGIGAGFHPPFLNLNCINKIIYIDDSEAFHYKELIQKYDNQFVGISSGAVIAGLIKLLNSGIYNKKNIVLIFADGGERYI